MKLPVNCLLVAVLMGLVPSVVAQAPAKGESADREQILQLERDWTQAFVTMDVAANHIAR